MEITTEARSKNILFPDRETTIRKKLSPSDEMSNSVISACPACPVAPEDGTGVAPADGTGVPPW